MPARRLPALLLFLFSSGLLLFSTGAAAHFSVKERNALEGPIGLDAHPDTNHALSHVPYNPLMALYALHLCKASYCVPETAAQSTSVSAAADVLRQAPPLQALGFELYGVYVNTSYGTLAYAGVDHVNQRVLVVFRGSSNLANWLSDLTFWSEHYPCPTNDSSSGSGNSTSSSSSSSSSGGEGHREGAWNSSERMQEHRKLMTDPGECRVHKGFYEAYHSLAPNVTRDLLQLHDQHPTYSFLVTGHSLGGALAYLCSLDLLARPAVESSLNTFTSLFEVYTFGEPRSGNEPLNAYAASLLEQHPNGNRKHFRLTHGRDPVPHLPPRSWGYIHQPQELWYYRNGTADDNPFVFAFCNGDAGSEDAMCSNSVWSTTVSDHLWYMGTCTHCLCTQPDMGELIQDELSPDLRRWIAEDCHPQSVP